MFGLNVCRYEGSVLSVNKRASIRPIPIADERLVALSGRGGSCGIERNEVRTWRALARYSYMFDASIWKYRLPRAAIKEN